MNGQWGDMEQFLALVHELEKQVKALIAKSDLTPDEKMFLLRHILIIPNQ